MSFRPACMRPDQLDSDDTPSYSERLYEARARPDQLDSDDTPSYSERLYEARARRDKIMTTWRSYFAWFTPEYKRLNREIERLEPLSLITWLEENKYLEQEGEQFNLFMDREKKTQIQLPSKLEAADHIKKIGIGRLGSIYNLYITPTSERLEQIAERYSRQHQEAQEEFEGLAAARSMAEFESSELNPVLTDEEDFTSESVLLTSESGVVLLTSESAILGV